MDLKFSECDYDFLRPPKDVLNVKHTDHYIKHGEGKKSIRKIFGDVPLHNDELAKLKEFEALIAKEKVQLPPGWTTIDSVKFLYAGKFDLKKSLKTMKQHLEWRAGPERGYVGPKALGLMETGAVYISGRDKEYRPVIVINVGKIDLKKVDTKDFIQALCFVLDVTRKYYYVPGKVENWIIIIETNGAGLFDFPVKLIKSINEVTSVNYTSTLEKLYIMNTSSLLKRSWMLIQSFLDPETASKISLTKKDDYGSLLDKIPKDQIEKCYGGTLPSRPTFWPPINTLDSALYIDNTKQNVQESSSETKAKSPMDIVYNVEPNKSDLRNSNGIQNIETTVSKNFEGHTSKDSQYNESRNVQQEEAVLNASKTNAVNHKEPQQIVTILEEPETKSVVISEIVNNKRENEASTTQSTRAKEDGSNETFLTGRVELKNGAKKDIVYSKLEEPEEYQTNYNKNMNIVKKEDVVVSNGAKLNGEAGDLANINVKATHGKSGDKYLINENKEDDSRGMIMERNEVKTPFCGFCRSGNNSEEPDAKTCNIF